MVANPIAPSEFPDERYPYAVKFVQDHLNKGKMKPEVFRSLWDQGCIEVDNLPACDLSNPIHPCFAAERFALYLVAAQHSAIEPAILLAFKLVTQPRYPEFFTHINADEPEVCTSQVKGKEIREHYITEPQD